MKKQGYKTFAFYFTSDLENDYGMYNTWFFMTFNSYNIANVTKKSVKVADDISHIFSFFVKSKYYPRDSTPKIDNWHQFRMQILYDEMGGQDALGKLFFSLYPALLQLFSVFASCMV